MPAYNPSRAGMLSAVIRKALVMNVKLDTESIRHAAGLSIPSQIRPIRAPFPWFFQVYTSSRGNGVHPNGKVFGNQLFLENRGISELEKLLFIRPAAGVWERR